MHPNSHHSGHVLFGNYTHNSTDNYINHILDNCTHNYITNTNRPSKTKDVTIAVIVVAVKPVHHTAEYNRMAISVLGTTHWHLWQTYLPVPLAFCLALHSRHRALTNRNHHICQSQACSRAHACAHACAHTHTHIHECTHACTHTHSSHIT